MFSPLWPVGQRDPSPGRFFPAWAAVVIILLSGCAVGPDYVRPTAVAPESYKELTGWKVAEPSDTAMRGPWWEIYGDPQLNELEEQVDAASQTLAAAEATFRQARALIGASRAAYFPQVTLGAGVTRTRASANMGPSAASPSTSNLTVSDFLLPLDASWELDLWGRVRRTVESSKASAQASGADLETARLSLQTELAQDYFQLRALDAQAELYDKTIKVYTTIFERTRNRYETGVAAKSDLLLAETQLKTTQAQSIDIGVQRAQLEHAIAVIIGKPASVFSIPHSPLSLEPPPIPVGVPSELLERRPDIAAAERRVAAANAQIGVAKAAYFPTITLSASGGLQASHPADWLKWSSRIWSLGAAFSETLFDGGLRKAQTDQAQAAYDASVASYRQTVLTGFQEVEDNLAALRILENEANAQDAAVKASRASQALSTDQYSAGTISYLDLLIVQAVTLANERTAINILGRRVLSSVLLIKALGGGWEASSLPPSDKL